jgi:CheY-like chemotaxis protein
MGLTINHLNATMNKYNAMADRTCLLIDDDEDDREIFQIAIEEAHANLKCVTAKTGIEAIKILSEKPDKPFTPDYIFLDINMPLMNGEECLVELRKLARLSTVPIFIYTTSEVKDKESFLKKGANEIMTKPVKVSELVELLKTVTQ